VSCPTRWSLAAALLAATAPCIAQMPPSTCYGTTAHGRIENAVALPREGANFTRMSQGPISATRVYVHSVVHEVMLDAFAALAKERPKVRFVYGETGLAAGGPIPPHQTHQNGLSMDLFVPVVDERGDTVPFPARLENGFGYQVDFDAAARYGNLRIDFASLAELLYQLHIASHAKGIALASVIFDRQYLPRLFETARGPWLREHIPFLKSEPLIRHDDHIHVDFAVKCQ
jgi:penicillin-insensitive murein endopeptidase